MMKLMFLLGIVATLTGCAWHKNPPPEPNRDIQWQINNVNSFQLIKKKISEDQR